MCGCVTAENAGVILANIVAWAVAVSGSYAMNAMITFASKSGRRLSWRAYAGFTAAGLFGLLAETATLLALKAMLPVMVAKLAAIGAGFAVNFALARFVVFRPKGSPVEH